MKTPKNCLTLYFLLVLSFFSYFAMAKQAISETRDLPEFSGISLSNAITVYIQQGNTQSVRLEGPEEALEEIVTEVSGGELEIKNEDNGFWGWTNNVFNDYDEVTIYITMEELNNLSVSGSGRVEGEGVFRVDDLQIKVSGSGSVNLDTKADFIDTHISGSGRITLEGESETGESSISGSGKLIADKLETEKYTVKISGSGNCSIYATEEIEARISGSGSVRYKGEPSVVNTSVSGSGSVRKM